MHAGGEPSSSVSDTGSGNDPSAGDHAAGMPAADEAVRLRATPPRPTRPELKAASSDRHLRHRISCDSVVSLQLLFVYGEQGGGVGAAAVAAPLPALQLVFVYKYKAVPTLDAYAGLGSRDLTVRECAAWGAVVLPAGLATVTVDRFRACGSAAAQLAGLGCCYGVCSVVVDPVPSPPIPERDDTDSGKKIRSSYATYALHSFKNGLRRLWRRIIHGYTRAPTRGVKAPRERLANGHLPHSARCSLPQVAAATLAA